MLKQKILEISKTIGLNINPLFNEEEIIYFFKRSKVNWYYVSCRILLSEEFIEKFADKVDWFYISSYQELSEEFIEKFANKVDWYEISNYQKLSEDFIERNINRLCIKNLFLNDKLEISVSLFEKIKLAEKKKKGRMEK